MGPDILTVLVGVLSAIATAVAAYFTMKSAQATAKSAEATRASVEEAQKSREAEYAPYVLIYIEQHGEGDFYLIVKNIGKNAARNVKAIFTPELQLHRSHNTEMLAILHEGIAFLAPQQELRYFMGWGHSILTDPNTPKRYEVEVHWQGGSNNNYLDRQIVDTAMFMYATLKARYDK